MNRRQLLIGVGAVAALPALPAVASSDFVALLVGSLDARGDRVYTAKRPVKVVCEYFHAWSGRPERVVWRMNPEETLTIMGDGPVDMTVEEIECATSLTPSSTSSAAS